MSDSEDSSKQATQPPAWQQAASKASEETDTITPARESTMDLAKRFLEDDEVRDADREKKAEFLKSKGIAEADIHELLEQSDQQPITNPPTTQDARKQDLLPPSSSAATANTFLQESSKPDLPPIVTYPEFLTKPTKPPPLITASGLLNSLGVIAGISTFVYGATKYIVSPMVDSLTESRVEFHENANKNLAQLVDKLEHTVSEIPVTYHTSSTKNKLLTTGGGGGGETDSKDDDASSYDDPTELFHRDVGVQTSPQESPSQQYPWTNHYNGSSTSTPPKTSSTDTIQHQADRLGRMSVAVRTLASEMIAQAEDFAETKNALDKFSGDLHALTYPPESFGMGSNYMYGTTRSEPDDEIKKAKMNIRSVKGVLLSTRSFPATTR